MTISKEEQQWADDGLKHTFFVHKGYQPSYNYGEDINWQYWPVKDNELRWQLHRHKWFTPMGKAYRISGDEKYAKELDKAEVDHHKPTAGAMLGHVLSNLFIENVRLTQAGIYAKSPVKCEYLREIAKKEDEYFFKISDLLLDENENCTKYN